MNQNLLYDKQLQEPSILYDMKITHTLIPPNIETITITAPKRRKNVFVRIYKKVRKYIAKRVQRVRKATYIVGVPLVRKIVKMDPNRVLFASDSHGELTGNLKFIKAEADKRGYTTKVSLKPGLKIHRGLWKALKLCYELAKCQTIFLDDFYPIIYPLKIVKGQQLIQLWHASGAFKQVGYARIGRPGGPKEMTYAINHKNYTNAIVSCDAIRPDYSLAFGMDRNKIIATGMPKTDVYFDKEYVAEVRKRIRAELGIRDDQHFVMFCPTFRGNGQRSAYYPARFLNFSLFSMMLPENVIMGVKMHPFVTERTGAPEGVAGHPNLIDLGDRRDIDELLMASDMLITDYSSAIFDYALLDKPMGFYCPDLEEYMGSRSFFYPLEEYLMGPIAKTPYELAMMIRQPTIDEDALALFKRRYIEANDGHATKRVADLFLPTRSKNKD